MHQKIVMTHERSKWGVNLTILQPEDVSLQTKGADTIETHEPRVSPCFATCTGGGMHPQARTGRALKYQLSLESTRSPRHGRA
jgi:hypothetical protein